MGWEKVACWSTEAAISETRKYRGKVTMGAYRNLPTLFPTTPSPRPRHPYGVPFPKIGVRNPPKIPIAIISGTGKATNFKFGQNKNRVHPNKSLLNILDKRERGRIQGLPIFSGPHIISRTGKAMNFKFCLHIYRLNGNKNPFKISGKVAMGVVRDSRKFSGHPYIIIIIINFAQ